MKKGYRSFINKYFPQNRRFEMKKIVISLLLALTFSLSAFAEGNTPIVGFNGSTPITGRDGITPIVGAAGNIPAMGYSFTVTVIQIIAALRGF
jgi:hypothetical protein